jgi:hypothetical protein
MIMTKKHFEAIAANILQSRQWAKTPEVLEGLELVAIGLSKEFENMNPRFDRMRFLKACGLNIEG